ncbi:protein SpAN-like [Penaeus monodon]|uniref:protein SpAN-like n=1 Tax=Penaeus monodon TaxID=6687 RepID=UPI0018A767F5|nr:protein SpAN-like [Penaeus monodon]
MHAATGTQCQPPKALSRASVGFYRWPVSQSTGLPTATYRIDSSVRSPAMIRSAMNDWESHTCVRFVETSNISEPYINVLEDNGCYSYVGKTGAKGQKLSIGRGCYTAAIIRHELGHALGLFHEQTRADRDDYVQIFTENVRPGVEVNFQKEDNSVSYGQEYDFFSLMQYSSTAFTKNGGSTIVTLDPAMQIYLGQSDDLTFRDIAIVNHMYGCSDLWIASCSSSPPTCKNGGYLGPNCACRCPPGTSGSTCADIIGSYYPTPVCGGNITEATTIKTPNYPYKFPKGTNCVWWIHAPDKCQYPIITVNDFKLFSKASNGLCAWDRLEVRTDSLYSGSEYCGSDLASGAKITTSGQDIILYFHGALSSQHGFSFSVEFEMTCRQCSISQTLTSTHWKSPNYPSAYPPALQCSVSVQKTAPALTFLLYRNVRLKSRCKDNFVVNSPNGQTFRVCGRKRGSRRLIGSEHSASFNSGSAMGLAGWYLVFYRRRTSCHGVVDLSSSSSGYLKSKRYPRPHPKFSQCEWWLRAPAGQRIQLTFEYLVLATRLYQPDMTWYQNYYYQRLCNRGYVLLSMEGDASYPPSSEIREWREVPVLAPTDEPSYGARYRRGAESAYDLLEDNLR